MMNITDIDKNFSVCTKIRRDGIKFHSVFEEAFSIHGIIYENGKFVRMPESIAEKVSQNVKSLNSCNAGGRIRFTTDSDYVAVYLKYNNVGKMPHFALTGSAGMDMYYNDENGEIYAGTFIPDFNVTDTLEGILTIGGEKNRTITLNCPTYSGIKEIYIGLDSDCILEKAPAYKHSLPVVFYGSSITQGGCTSRPGNTYQGMLSRDLDFDYINLGFSGSARAEDEIADYISGLDMSVFVYDYDHNAPTVEHLLNTHERMFKRIREDNPDLPVIFMSRPKFHLNDQEITRLDIVKKTYDNAVLCGDKNVYFIPGNELIKPEFREIATVDNCHPNDTGFFCMAQTIKPILEKLL